jgi:hypothetical protein
LRSSERLRALLVHRDFASSRATAKRHAACVCAGMRFLVIAAACAAWAFGCASSDGVDGSPAVGDDSGDGGGGDGGTGSGGHDAGNATGDGGGATGNDGGTQNGQEQIEMVSGNGSDVLAGWPTSDPLIVRVTKNGQPVVGETVRWAVTPGAPLHAASNATTSTTDADGLAQIELVGEQFNVVTSWVAETVTASIAAGGSVPFIVTTVYPGPPVGNPAISPLVQITQPMSVDLGQLKAGTVVHGGLQIVVVAQIGPDEGKGIPNTGLRLVDPADPYHLAPAKGVSCVGGTILSDAQGHLSCDLQIGMTPGQVGVDAFVGGFNLHSLVAEIVP